MLTEKEKQQLTKEWYKKIKGKSDHDPNRENDWHNQGSGRYLADAVFAANDGIITTFAVVAGIAGAQLEPSIVLILGFANLLADGASMGLGNYLGQRSEAGFVRQLKKKEYWEIEHFPETETREVREIYAKKGFSGADLDRAVAIITANKEVWVDTMLKEELHVIDDPVTTPVRHGLVTYIAFIIAGVLPLVPFFIPGIRTQGFSWSIGMTFFALFFIGMMRSKLSDCKPWRAGFEMLFVGGIAAVIAYGVGVVLSHFVG